MCIDIIPDIPTKGQVESAAKLRTRLPPTRSASNEGLADHSTGDVHGQGREPR
jgi:hypothetical protein